MFETTRLLDRNEGLTISLTWPKGLVWEPTRIQKRNWWVRSNKGQLYALTGLLLVLLYYLGTWIFVGKDPTSGTIIPRYRMPDGLSAGEMRYLWRMAFDKKVFTAELLNLATFGYIEIEKESSNYKISSKNKAYDELSRKQTRILDILFEDGDTLSVNKSNYKTFQKAQKEFHKNLKSKHLKYHFYQNKKFFFIGVFLSFFSLCFSAWADSYEGFALVLFISVWLSFWTVGTFALGFQLVSLARSAIVEKSFLSTTGTILLSLAFLPFFAGELVGIFVLYQGTSLIFVLVAVCFGVSGYFFHRLIKQPTIRGQKIIDQVEGVRLYLGVAEEDRMRKVSDPDLSLELFEKFLPFAVALNVEQSWADRFAELLEKASQGNENGYSPSFYRGSGFSDTSSFSSSLGSSFSSAISGASASPSSSGSGGGGSSGGGGGGW